MRVPVVSLTGHLGAGKTSLLNHLLRTPGARLGVVINDFGSLNVDAALVTGQVDEAAAISGGCVCCLPDSGGLDDALEKLSDPRLRLDAIVIEASGAADPIALSRLVRFSGAERIRSGGVVEVVDAANHFDMVDTWPDPPARYAAASLVVVGKTDLVDDPQTVVDRIRERVARRNPRAQIVVARDGRIDPALVFDVASTEDLIDQLPIGALLREGAPAHVHVHAVTIPLPHAVAAGGLVELLEDPPAGAYRIKGRVRVRGGGGYLVNLVGRSIHVRSHRFDGPGELVAIGIDLDEPAARDRLAAVAGGVEADAAGLRRLQRYRRLSE
ncbi:cobalamin biosynthesis protein [Microbacterium sorbitolivorans]|uniref:Cobalamin biosynthesis protein CobW n=1 Tax=Microbacterium sorbitolivorans TaxID=1867410 RepID=A0A367Y877_9MICO|nr:CobW family GTP-binding protein [Microbacterium sorbitolivorans]RCK62038.1 cobalamin biosynthesis protein CobW [Microbacterium sorbitolivorans]GGF43658.1 cobalamin biosynthesis protein [Microbacterium sorbitolivorans]